MANVLTTIIAWEVFQALATILIFLTLSKFLSKWTKDDSEKKKQIKKGFTIFIILLMVFTILSGFYIVNTNEKVVLNKITGGKVIIKDVGIHYSFMGQAKPFFMGKQNLEFPKFQDLRNADLSELYGETEMVSLDGKVIRFSAVLYYQIADLDKFAIQSQATEEKLFYYLNSEITNQISNTLYKDAIENRKQLEVNIKNSFGEFEETYGVKILDFNFMRIADAAITITAKINAENEKIKAEAMIKSTKSKVEAEKIKVVAEKEKADMLEGSSQKVLDYLLEMEKYSTIKEREGDVIWIIPDINTPIVLR